MWHNRTTCFGHAARPAAVVGGELYSYDDLDQLEGFQLGTLTDTNADGRFYSVTSPSRTQSWDYDSLGNWNSVSTNGVAQTRVHNAQNEIENIIGAFTPTYDNNGNLIRDEAGRTFKHDAWNRLVEASDSSSMVVAQHRLRRRLPDGMYLRRKNATFHRPRRLH
jgi:hypothetical protein